MIWSIVFVRLINQWTELQGSGSWWADFGCTQKCVAGCGTKGRSCVLWPLITLCRVSWRRVPGAGKGWKDCCGAGVKQVTGDPRLHGSAALRAQLRPMNKHQAVETTTLIRPGPRSVFLFPSVLCHLSALCKATSFISSYCLIHLDCFSQY